MASVDSSSPNVISKKWDLVLPIRCDRILAFWCQIVEFFKRVYAAINTSKDFLIIYSIHAIHKPMFKRLAL